MGIMNADSLKNNIGNPARNYLFDVTIPNPRGEGDTGTLELRCRAASIPRRGVTTFNVAFKQTAGVEYPGKLDYDHSWALEFYEGEDAKSFTAFHSWAQLIVDDYAGTGVNDPDLKTDLYLTLLTRADGTSWKRIKLIGCFPKDMASIPVSWDNKDQIILKITMNFDRWEVVE
jgi:hypothetical protein